MVDSIPCCTLAGSASFTGITLFTAASTTITLSPAPVGHGICFLRCDAAGAEPIEAVAENVASADSRRTILGSADHGVQTVEHMLSALAGMGVTDCLVSVDGPEVPIGDGSARFVVEMIEQVGTKTLESAPIEPQELKSEIKIQADGAFVRAVPVSSLAEVSYSYRLSYPHKPAMWGSGQQRFCFTPSADSYAELLAPARTFCLAQEAVAMRQQGLFSHLSEDDMLVLDDAGGGVGSQPRWPDEPARHKVLDMVGDLALIGVPVLARFEGDRSGHAMNLALARAVRDTVGR